MKTQAQQVLTALYIRTQQHKYPDVCQWYNMKQWKWVNHSFMHGHPWILEEGYAKIKEIVSQRTLHTVLSNVYNAQMQGELNNMMFTVQVCSSHKKWGNNFYTFQFNGYLWGEERGEVMRKDHRGGLQGLVISCFSQLSLGNMETHCTVLFFFKRILGRPYGLLEKWRHR